MELETFVLVIDHSQEIQKGSWIVWIQKVFSFLYGRHVALTRKIVSELSEKRTIRADMSAVSI
jgi:hypothetical protein